MVRDSGYKACVQHRAWLDQWRNGTRGTKIGFGHGHLGCAGIAKGAGHPNAAKLFLDWALSREGQALMVEQGSFSSLAQAPMPPGVDSNAIKAWYSDEAEIEKIFKPWTDDWNRAYGYRQ